MSGGRAFQSLTVLGKDSLLLSVLQVTVWKALWWLCLVDLFGGINLECLLMATNPLSILNIIQRRASFLLFSRLLQFRLWSMSLTLEVLRCLLRTYLAALQLLDIGLGVWVPYGVGIFYQGANKPEVGLLLDRYCSYVQNTRHEVAEREVAERDCFFFFFLFFFFFFVVVLWNCLFFCLFLFNLFLFNDLINKC